MLGGDSGTARRALLDVLDAFGDGALPGDAELAVTELAPARAAATALAA